jgi:acidic leucine-rich nuclear phosphoprotein 32 family protein B
MEFQKALQDKLGEHEPIEVDELILDDLFEGIDTFTNDHKKSLELYKNLVHLSLNGLGLKSLSNFPKLEQLQILELRQNKLSGNDFAELVKLYPNLYKLKVGENPIKSLDVFKPFVHHILT